MGKWKNIEIAPLNQKVFLATENRLCFYTGIVLPTKEIMVQYAEESIRDEYYFYGSVGVCDITYWTEIPKFD